MDQQALDEMMHLISKGKTDSVESLFARPGGRKYFERLVMVLVCNLPFDERDKEDLLTAFHHTLDHLEKRIKRQREGGQILRQVYDPR